MRNNVISASGPRSGRNAAARRPALLPMLQHLEPRLLLSGYTLQELAAFNGTNGLNPIGSVVLDSNGNLFGETATGGPANEGVIYEIAKGSNTITVLTSFNGLNGVNPVGGLIADSNGDLFGTTEGNNTTAGTVFELANGAASITTLASFNGVNSNASGPVGPLFLDQNTDTLFGTTLAGGEFNDGVVYKVVSGTGVANTVTSLNSATSSGAEGGLIEDSSGDLFGTSTTGGTFSQGSVFEIQAGTGNVTALASFDGADGGGIEPEGQLYLDSKGDLFGTTFAGGLGYGTVFEIPSGTTTIETIAEFQGPASTSYGQPQAGVIADSNGDLFGTTSPVTGTDNSSVFEVVNGSSTIMPLASLGNGGNNGTQSSTLQQGGPVMDAAGDLFVAAQGTSSSDGAVFELVAPTVTPTPKPTAILVPTVATNKVPVSVVAGEKLSSASLGIKLTDTAATGQDGTVVVNVYASTSPTFDASADQLVGTVTRNVNVKAGKTVSTTVPIKGIPAALADGTYYLLVQSSDTAGTSIAAAAPGTFTVAAPFVSLSGTVTSQKLSSPLTSDAKAKGTVKILIVNNGNVIDNGFSIDLMASSDPDTTGTSILTSTKSTKIKPGKSVTVSLSLKSLPVLAAGSFVLVAQITDANGGTSFADGSQFTVT